MIERIRHRISSLDRNARPLCPISFEYTAVSRYVLNADGTFALRSASVSDFRGRYKYEAGRMIFDFDWNAQREGAIGVFDGHRMTVIYNQYMSLSDFEDAVYLLKPPADAK